MIKLIAWNCIFKYKIKIKIGFAGSTGKDEN